MNIKRFIVISGYAFLLIGVFDFIRKVDLFGFRALDFLWFCSISMFLLGFGMIFKNEVLLNSFLSIALLVQPFWMLDYAWLTFFNTPLNGVSSFVFRPGYSLVQFVLNARHMYMIPFGFISVFAISRKNRASYLFISAFVILLLGSSYIFAPKSSNLNCVFEPCLKVFGKINGLPYSFLYTTIILIISLFINFILNMLLELFKGVKNKRYYKRFVLTIFIFLLLISTITIVFAFLKYSKLPKYVCMGPDLCSECHLNLKCNYIDTDSENLALIYTIKNYWNQDYVCDIFMIIYPTQSDYTKIVDNSFIESHKKYELKQILPYPSKDSQIKLKLNCKILS